jgi:hypothetical protein
VQLRHALENSAYRFAVEGFSTRGALAGGAQRVGQLPDSSYPLLAKSADVPGERHNRLIKMSAAIAPPLGSNWAPHYDRHEHL